MRRLFAGLASSRDQRDAAEAEHAPIVPEIPAALLKAEVDALPAAQRLTGDHRCSVFYARAAQIPWVLQEIGRLRELIFRAAGEGTGRVSDIDLFDAYYLHLFIWDAAAGRIVGAYRMGLTDEILGRHGKRGLYTYSLFKYGSWALRGMNPGIELGRSFVRCEYRKEIAPLLLLWRGIGEFVARSPRYAVLFGLVSISNSYKPVSRRLIVDYLQANKIEPELARHVKPRRPFPSDAPLDWNEASFLGLDSIEEVSRTIELIERDRKGVPIAIKHYLTLGGKLLAFSADETSNNVLDALMMVDLRASPPPVLAGYLGEEGAAVFLAHHGAGPDLILQAC